MIGHGALPPVETAPQKDILPGATPVAANVASQALSGHSKNDSDTARSTGQHHGAVYPKSASNTLSAMDRVWPDSMAVKQVQETQKSLALSVHPVEEMLLRSDDHTNHPEAAATQSTFATRVRSGLSYLATPIGFLLLLYGLNIVAWGGMLFLLLCGASPAMCWYTDPSGQSIKDCNSNDSPRKIWIEIDSQILNALFCVTGLGLVPWRLRDLYYLLSYRLRSELNCGRETKQYGLRMLASHYRSWIRLPVSTQGHGSKAIGVMSEPFALLRPTPIWRIDVFVWSQIANTLFQICLCYWMWAYDRISRPSWATGLFVGLACGVAGIGGIVSYFEGRQVMREEAAIRQEPV